MYTNPSPLEALLALRMPEIRASGVPVLGQGQGMPKMPHIDRNRFL
jgi:hypothetical protein